MLCIVTSGCFARRTVLHPVEDVDIIFLEKGEQLTAPDRGAYLSDEYLSEVMKVQFDE